MFNPEKYKVIDEHGRQLEPDEFFLLRRGDMLAIATLRSYASNALLITELERMGAFYGYGSIGASEFSRAMTHLVALADHCSDLADHWQNDNHHKLPD